MGKCYLHEGVAAFKFTVIYELECIIQFRAWYVGSAYYVSFTGLICDCLLFSGGIWGDPMSMLVQNFLDSRIAKVSIK